MINQTHILFVLLGYQKSTIDEFFNYAICQINQSEALAAMGYRVSVFTRFSEDHKKTKNGVDYHFVNDGKKPVLKRWENAKLLLQKVIEQEADIIHFHGFIFPVVLSNLIKAKGKNTKIIAEYHSDPIFRTMKAQQGKTLQKVDRLIFANKAAADLWSNTFKFPEDHSRLSVECAPSSKFTPRPKAREISGFSGAPIFLWNSRLITRRDPMTVLEGYEQFLKNGQFPECHFYWMVPDSDKDLIDRVKQRISRSEWLSKAITLMEERKPHHELGSYFNSADYVITGSLEDGYGYGVADAMSCGVVPIATNISTFMHITKNGTFGSLWEAGSADALAKTLLQEVSSSYPVIEEEAQRIVSHFESELSAQSQAANLASIYQEVIHRI
jgi:glycosyltransferase involved in cell wall biosynthesis